ncbi:unnamed protein product [Caenorhabditis bovis]|uniref:ETS domain-containing protein n=1 Tax=Caenorhabditis bovis TaxID=2654633 RepID=A0A8S1EFP5_9PELO|nr:unnamed protein product [Caenorhabditis bovis]
MNKTDPLQRWNSMSPDLHSGTESSVSTPFVKCEFPFDDELFGIDQVNHPNQMKDDTMRQQPSMPPMHFNRNMSNGDNNGFVKNEIEESILNFNVPNNDAENVDSQQMDIYRDLILRHLIQDISTTCAKLGLPTDPYIWNEEHSARWINEMCLQFNLKPPRQIFITGRSLLGMSVKEFESLTPEGGDTLHAQLQVWKTAFESYHPPATIQSNGMTASDNGMDVKPNWMSTQTNSSMAETPNQSSFFHGNGNAYGNETMHIGSFFQPGAVLPSPSNSETSSNGSSQDMNDEDMELMNGMNCNGPPNFFHPPGYMPMSPMNGMCNTTVGDADEDDRVYSRHQGTVHLWQFIRELLDQPKQYNTCVRWVDRDEGTFKIESSLLLARYWGQRKNRSQMNYDKLSRSLRQYYKKGIIQKPEKKQRLVYKFLPPYNM